MVRFEYAAWSAHLSGDVQQVALPVCLLIWQAHDFVEPAHCPCSPNAVLNQATMQAGFRAGTSRASSRILVVQRHGRSRRPQPQQPALPVFVLPPAAVPRAASSAAAAVARCATAARPAAACTGGSTGRSAGACRRSGRLRLVRPAMVAAQPQMAELV